MAIMGHAPKPNESKKRHITFLFGCQNHECKLREDAPQDGFKVRSRSRGASETVRSNTEDKSRILVRSPTSLRL